MNTYLVDDIPLEQVKAIGNFPRQPNNNPYPNNYTPAYKNHPNVSWNNNQGHQPRYHQNPPQYPPYRPSYGLNPRPFYDTQRPQMPQHQQPLPQMTKPEVSADSLSQFMIETRSSIQSLETQVGQLAKLMADRNHGALPSSTVVNPKEQCQAVTLRSGTKYEGPIVENKGKKIEDQPVPSPAQEEVTEDLPKKETPKYTEPTPKIRYPQRFQKANLDKQFSKFLDIFRKLHINIPFAEALEQMPSYVKFMKEILSRKRKLEDYETVALTEECNTIL
ncbi:uncharacterized protein LOC133832580 [Humulus lupulus]|uniref:uncharacterized protein LOC133832580 n=1 Tax=Humulus lupulus TaxID=3486 RepID=UPI002B4086CC|nr:uncharacterized protein LOC133832580 [Humulus lupulus]